MCRYLTRIGQVLPASTVSHLNQESGFIHRMPIGYEALSSEQGWFISKENKEFNIVIHADDYIYIHFTNVLTQKACRKKMWDMTYKNMMPWVTWHCIFGMISLVLVNEKGKLQNRTVRTVLTSPRRHSADPRVEHNSKVEYCRLRTWSVSDLLRHICPLLEFPQLSERCSQNLPTLVNLVLKR